MNHNDTQATPQGSSLRAIFISLLSCMLLCSIQGCQKAFDMKNNGLKPGINYMQPMKWRMTYRYRVQEIKPSIPYNRERPSAYDPSIPAVGDGTYEVWMVGPREGEEVRNVKMIYSHPEPTKVTTGKDDLTYYYYDFAPDGRLPKELQATIQWECITFERYTFWEGMDYGEYDKESELYKRYTKEEWPILTHHDMQVAAQKCIPREAPGDYVATSLNAYNEILMRFNYDHYQGFDVIWAGSTAMTDSVKCWDTKTGVCDDFANVYVALLRHAGIPARTCSGLVHGMVPDEAKVFDRLLTPSAGHAWIEFYLPKYGWIPADPTWGQAEQNIEPLQSIIGSVRGMNFADYYFGKSDAYRLTQMKEWNLALQPPPRTPKAKAVEPWFIGYTERYSGTSEVNGGWPGVPGLQRGSLGWARSEKYATTKCALEIEALGPVDRAEIKDIIEQFESENAHYLEVPKVPGDWPMVLRDDRAMGEM